MFRQNLTDCLCMQDAGGSACTAARQQLAGVAGVMIEGVPKVEFNSVYLPAGEHEGWLRFESADGKHLHRQIEQREWQLADGFDPSAKGFEKPRIETQDGLLPTGSNRWTLFDGTAKKFIQEMLAVSLLAAGAEEVKEAERRLAEREAEWRERQRRLPEQMEIYRTCYIPKDEQRREAAAAEQRKQQLAAAASDPAEAAATAAADQGEHGEGT